VKVTLRLYAGLALIGAAIAAHADGLLHVQQTIFGMDCAPCAYGVQQRLTKLPGVTKVEVSLNDGTADIGFASDSATTIPQIYDVLVQGGFTPKQAVVTVQGRIAKEGDRLKLITGDSQYELAFAHPGDSTAWQADAKVVVLGEIADPGAAGAPVLQVQKIEAAGPGATTSS
jgi:copper chaperone CopZ